jgi:hypothetical protein
VVEAKVSDDDSPLTPAAYQRIVHARFSGENVATEAAVDAVRFLSALGVRTCGSARRFFQNDLLERLLERAQSLPDDAHPWVPAFKKIRGTSGAYKMHAPRLHALAEILRDTPLGGVFDPEPGEAV